MTEDLEAIESEFLGDEEDLSPLFYLRTRTHAHK